MKTCILSAFGCALLSTAVCLTIWNVLSAGVRPAVEQIATDLEHMKGRLERLERGQMSVLERADGLGKKLSQLATTMARDMAAQARPGAAADGVTPASGGSDLEDEAHDEIDTTDLDLEDTLDLLAEREVSYSEKQKLWAAIGKAEQMDEAVAFFETRARENPDDPDAQFELGSAYVQKLLTVDDVRKLKWAQRADGSFDAALAIDDHHWGARFSKAMSYAFTPAVLGFGPRAIEQFEILRAQQEEGAPRQNHAQTYLLLGNLYANQGKAEKAREVWVRGAEIFPEHRELGKAAQSGGG